MQVTLEDLLGLERKLNVTIPSERVQGEVKAKLQEIAQKAKLPGFRPGKVPFEVVQKNYGKSAYSQVVEDLVRSTYPEAIQKENLTPVSHPKIEIVSTDPEGHFIYNATFEVYPEIKLTDFEKIEVEKAVASVSESDINEMLDKMRKSHAQWEEIEDPLRKAQEGDQLTIDFTVKPKDSDVEPKTEKDVKFTLGDGFMWDDFEKQLYGVSPGEEKSYSLDMPSTHMDKSLADNKVDFDVKVHKVCYPILPELNDEFAAKMNIKEGGLEKLKDEVRVQMERELEQVLKDLFKQTVMNELFEQIAVEVPRVLIEQELDRISQNWIKRYEGQGNVKPEFPRAEFESQARRNVGLGLLMAEIVKENKIEVSPEDVRKKTEEMVLAYNLDDDNRGEMIKKMLADQGYMRDIKSTLLEEKVIDHLASQINILEKVMSYKEAMEKK